MEYRQTDGKTRRVHKQYVDVVARILAGGQVVPVTVCWVDGRCFTIDEIVSSTGFGLTVHGVRVQWQESCHLLRRLSRRFVKGRSMNDIQGYQNGPIETGASRAKEMSPRAYNLVMSALIFLGFCAMGAGAYFTSTMSFARMMMSGAALPLVFGSFILTIVGMVMMSAAASKQSVGLSLVGYVIFASTFGLTASFGLANYDLPTINTAFIATAAITFVFGALGVTFPKFFQRVYGIGFGILLATVLVEIVLMFMGVSQSITDLIVIVVFAGFIGYDTYVATTVPPTLPNAVLMASNLFVDIINVFLRILNILGRRD